MTYVYKSSHKSFKRAYKKEILLATLRDECDTLQSVLETISDHKSSSTHIFVSKYYTAPKISSQDTGVYGKKAADTDGLVLVEQLHRQHWTIPVHFGKSFTARIVGLLPFGVLVYTQQSKNVWDREWSGRYIYIENASPNRSVDENFEIV